MNAEQQQRLRELALIMLRDAHGEDFTAEQAALLPAQIEEYQRLTEPQEILSLLDNARRAQAQPSLVGAAGAGWMPPSTAPNDRLFIADMGLPWACIAIWNEPSGQFCITELEVGLYDGQLNDTAITHTYEPVSMLRGWMEMPEVCHG
ncbi:hypothetical protein [Ectopseudomonas oleovorans]|uniref:Uncharacterized protein n=1 Tax=Ectopseudomonas oleovorans TaxID=301 RepID=A0AA42QDM5_ECTOL|nr:hypothetical protein [Pseudomonas oleovorans]MDH1341889.1 hypothetical protein [Pseudomonas oleovorans]MDH1490885.1 hypothetical protein [Pseudomonas oleovorans]WGG19612.1 hypothetical protein N5O83_14135 [Pseudomonas oleovorans]